MLNETYTITPISEHALRLSFHDAHPQAMITQCMQALEQVHYIIDLVPAYTTLTIIYDVVQLLDQASPLDWMTAAVLDATNVPLRLADVSTPIIKIPVCYGSTYGPDLETLAALHNMSTTEVIERHCTPIYDISMLGFAPGFPYLSGLDTRLATPRKQTPALRIPKGAVGIAGAQTGIYSIETPGGWHIIGRTPIDLFQPIKTPPTLLKAGDRLQFVPITAKQFETLEAKK